MNEHPGKARIRKKLPRPSPSKIKKAPCQPTLSFLNEVHENLAKVCQSPLPGGIFKINLFCVFRIFFRSFHGGNWVLPVVSAGRSGLQNSSTDFCGFLCPNSGPGVFWFTKSSLRLTNAYWMFILDSILKPCEIPFLLVPQAMNVCRMFHVSNINII